MATGKKISELTEVTAAGLQDSFYVPVARENDTAKASWATLKGELMPTDEQVTDAVDDWLTDHPEATTTVQDGAVTDTKLVQTDGALSAHVAAVNDTIPMKVINNSYVNNIGNINSANGWDRTDYVNVRGIYQLKVTATVASNYNCFYDKDKVKIGGVGDNPSIAIGTNTVNVPADAVYAIFSGTAAYVAGLSIAALKTVDEVNIGRHTDLIQTDLLGKQVLVLDPDDLTLYMSINAGGDVISNDATALTTEYLPILHPENKYRFECPGFRLYFVEYTKNQDGTYTMTNNGNYIDNGGTFWAVTGTTHVRIVFRVAGRTLNETLARDFCNVFVMREERDINDYIRVCTFNMARDYASLTGADAAGIQAQILNYLNFIGQYDPDVIQAQEAGGEYWDDGSTKNMNTTVFNRKYIFSRWPMHNRKTWSKFNLSEPTYTVMNATYDGKTRAYTKMYLHVDGKVICLLNAHCEYEGTFAECRQLQFQELATEMGNHEYCILCGDFNAYDASEFDEFSGFNMVNCGEYGEIDTWLIGQDYPGYPFKAMDNIITTTNIKIQNVVRGPYDFSNFSDHAPLMADLQIR